MSEQLHLFSMPEKDSPLFPALTGEILQEIWVERSRQDMKWGVQDHPYFSSEQGGASANAKTYSEMADEAKQLNDSFVSSGKIGWNSILIEELFEALGEAGVDDEAYERELVETAAVAVAMIEANRRKRRFTK